MGGLQRGVYLDIDSKPAVHLVLDDGTCSDLSSLAKFAHAFTGIPMIGDQDAIES